MSWNPLGKCPRCQTFASRFRYKVWLVFDRITLLNSTVARKERKHPLVCIQCWYEIMEEVDSEVGRIYEKRIRSLIEAENR